MADSTNRSMPTPRAADGFTLIEILIVIAILGLLAAALLPNIIGASEAQQNTETQARIQRLRTAVEAFERKYDFFPPADFQPLDPQLLPMQGKTDKINAGIESAMIALHWKSFGGATFDETPDWLSNTDGDDYGKTIPLLGRSAKVELADAWGNPIAYIDRNGFAGSHRIMLGEAAGKEVVTVKAWKDSETGLPLGNRKGYQIVSAGPDAMFNTEDDLTWPDRAR